MVDPRCILDRFTVKEEGNRGEGIYPPGIKQYLNGTRTYGPWLRLDLSLIHCNDLVSAPSHAVTFALESRSAALNNIWTYTAL